MIVGGTGEEPFTLDEATGEVSVEQALTAGTYNLLVNVDVDRVLSNTHELQVTVE